MAGLAMAAMACLGMGLVFPTVIRGLAGEAEGPTSARPHPALATTPPALAHGAPAASSAPATGQLYISADHDDVSTR